MEDIQSKKDTGEKVIVKESARDIIFLLDVSASMGAEDLYPNRLSKAKEMIGDILSVLDGEHVGLVVFTSVPSVKSILTLDYSYFRDVLGKVRINDNDFAGTKFGPALNEIIHKQFDFSENKYKDLIIITDGGDTDIEGLSGADRTAMEEKIYDLCEEAYLDQGIRIHTIGLGTKAGAIVRNVQDSQGQQVKSRLNEEFLKNISQRAKGVAISAADSFLDIKEIYKSRIAAGSREEIGREVEVDPDKLQELVEKQKEEGEQKVVYKELYPFPVLLALLLLSVEFFIPEKKRAIRK
jgi:Ca-activated chloride channel family protein